MSPFYPVKEEYPEPTCSFSWESPANLLAPRPMEGLNVAAPPPFLTKTYEMVEDESTKEIVYWSRGGHSFVVGDPNAFSSYLLPRFFKHNNFSSFVRQLNTYGFRKIDPERWEFANEGFVKGQRHLLKSIKRRKTPSLPVWFARHHHGVGSVADPRVEVGRFGLDGEVNQLRRDKQVLMTEIVKLRQQEQSTRAYLQAMEHRLQAIEIKQQQMMSFLARAMQNPAFLQQLVQQKEKRKELEMALNRKRRRPIEHGRQGGGWVAVGPSGVKAEPLEFKEHSSYGYKGRHGMSELEELALEMQGYGRGREAMEEDEEIDDEFWEDLMKERFKQMVQKEGEEKEES